jgi:hypothetical protein
VALAKVQPGSLRARERGSCSPRAGRICSKNWRANARPRAHGVIGLSDSLRQEVKQNGLEDIHICTIMPTAHDTPFFEHAANYSDHEVTPPKPLHDPQHVVDTIVRVARKPDDKKIVGADGVVKLVTANLMPAVSEKMGARQMHRTIEKAPPAGDSPGSVLEPVSEGAAVSGGNRKKRPKGTDREEKRRR